MPDSRRLTNRWGSAASCTAMPGACSAVHMLCSSRHRTAGSKQWPQVLQRQTLGQARQSLPAVGMPGCNAF